MNKRGWSQQELATSARLKQGTVSRAANPNYGNLTLNTIIRIAAGFDVAFIGRFVPFSELDKWALDLSEESVKSIPTFEEESAVGKARSRGHADDRKLQIAQCKCGDHQREKVK